MSCGCAAATRGFGIQSSRLRRCRAGSAASEDEVPLSPAKEVVALPVPGAELGMGTGMFSPPLCTHLLENPTGPLRAGFGAFFPFNAPRFGASLVQGHCRLQYSQRSIRPGRECRTHRCLLARFNPKKVFWELVKSFGEGLRQFWEGAKKFWGKSEGVLGTV